MDGAEAADDSPQSSDPAPKTPMDRWIEAGSQVPTMDDAGHQALLRDHTMLPLWKPIAAELVRIQGRAKEAYSRRGDSMLDELALLQQQSVVLQQKLKPVRDLHGELTRARSTAATMEGRALGGVPDYTGGAYWRALKEHCAARLKLYIEEETMSSKRRLAEAPVTAVAASAVSAPGVSETLAAEASEVAKGAKKRK